MKALDVIFSKVSGCSRSKNPFIFLNPCAIINVPKYYTESLSGFLISCPYRAMKNMSNCHAGLSENVGFIIWSHSLAGCFCLQNKYHVCSLIFRRHCLKDVDLIHRNFSKHPFMHFPKIENAKQNCKFVQCKQRTLFPNVYTKAYLYVIWLLKKLA